MNPTRGGDEQGDYTEQMLETYKHKISGPILDRIDLWLTVPHVDYKTLTEIRDGRQNRPGKTETDLVREKVTRARKKQHARFKERGILTNSEMSARDIEECIELAPAVRELLKRSSEKMNLSPRSYHRLVKVSRTIADIEDAEQIEEAHVLEALNFRVKL